MIQIIPLDAKWCASHGLPQIDSDCDKNSRGRVLLVGGARFVPGALALTGEAVLRAGAGKLQMATVDSVASALGVLVPEAAMIGLPMREDGEIAKDGVGVLADLVPQCDLLLVGPGMSATAETGLFVRGLLALSPPAMLLDAAALTCTSLTELANAARKLPLILTPHHGEMARLIGRDPQAVAADPVHMVCQIVEQTGAYIALKGPETWIGGPGMPIIRFTGGCPGLGVGGSGDVLAGIVGGLLARGAAPIVALGWGVALHGAAGQLAAAEIGEIGFLARELLPLVPRLMETLGQPLPAQGNGFIYKR
ncbi:NAD(P)H-hydrate dehydratase [Sphingobium sp. TCM1]|uniref:NAD(P)H-hydrate dehydratase n=1 Tax=Sphingobium sp. TCM1 TaxID=453246 RepID=UPI0007F32F19|nr:NAD(P)H-hydrate dehydratase [Sphingobium sp. TCM1]OAN58920.1 NAD(P)H-hydrate dehydratase [Sphingobium sp. TCM1]